MGNALREIKKGEKSVDELRDDLRFYRGVMENPDLSDQEKQRASEVASEARSQIKKKQMDQLTGNFQKLADAYRDPNMRGRGGDLQQQAEAEIEKMRGVVEGMDLSEEQSKWMDHHLNELDVTFVRDSTHVGPNKSVAKTIENIKKTLSGG
jgi:hypothetical protein